MPTHIPRRFLKRDTVYRYFGDTSRDRIIGCGFLLKPDAQGGFRKAAMDSYSGVLLLRGTGTYVDEPTGRSWDLKPGHFFQRLPDRAHTQLVDPDGKWAEAYVVFGAPLYHALASLGSLGPDQPVIFPGLSVELVQRFARLAGDLRSAPEDELHHLLARIHELVTDIHSLDRRQRRPDPHANAIEEACRQLGVDLATKISMPTLAKKLGVGYERFRKVFRERMGMSPGEYRIRRRVERARAMLAQGDVSVKEVAFRLGYPNAYAFSRQFKSVTGGAPSRFLRVP